MPFKQESFGTLAQAGFSSKINTLGKLLQLQKSQCHSVKISKLQKFQKHLTYTKWFKSDVEESNAQEYFGFMISAWKQLNMQRILEANMK